MADSGLNNEDPEAGKNGAIVASIALFILLLIGVVSDEEIKWLYVAAIGACFVYVWYLYNASEPTRHVSQNQTAQVLDQTSLYGRFSDALQYPVFIIGGGGTTRYVNSAGRKVFQRPAVGDLITVRFRQPELRRAIETALAEKRIVSLEYNEAVPDDRWFAVEISPIPMLKDEDNYANGLFAVVFHELTETKRIDQMRSDFVANASHELRTPLASLVGYLETINGPAKNDDAARQRFIGVMLDQAERMSRLVNDLLSLSRIEMKAHLKPSDSVNVTEVLASVADSLGQMASQMGVEINFDKSKDVYVQGDRHDLLQVFENIIENGCKYGQDGKRVDVELIMPPSEDSEFVTVSVKDYGPGIATEHQQRITERFYRVDVARSREKQGTGLGLAIVKHILQRHGTRLQIKSAPGEGADFRVQLKKANVSN